MTLAVQNHHDIAVTAADLGDLLTEVDRTNIGAAFDAWAPTLHGLDVAAEAYARLGIAVHDAFIVCWYAKYTYNLLRPVTYINRVIDPTWLPFLTT